MSDLETVYHQLLQKPATEEGFPFGPEAAVYKVAGKMFAILIPEDMPPRLNLKCDPDRAVALRDEYEAILPGYHMNKKHWNTLELDGSLPANLVGELIDHSYELVVAGLPRKQREKLE
ncbi:MAG: MmcQ/YjbR family DNA-binding protein [Verrucomicrobiota bacterium]